MAAHGTTNCANYRIHAARNQQDMGVTAFHSLQGDLDITRLQTREQPT
jgi:hypothetical protein